MSFQIHGDNPLQIDLSPLEAELNHLQLITERTEYERLLQRTVKEVSQRTKKIVWDEVRGDYEVKRAWVYSAFGAFRMTVGGGGNFPVQCVIPLSGKKGVLGNKGTFRAQGGKQHISKRVKAKIVKGTWSTLPERMVNQGGNKPFQAKGMIFTRRTKDRLPIVRVAGVGVPQMPLNRSRADIEKELVDLMEARLRHNFNYMVQTGQIP